MVELLPVLGVTFVSTLISVLGLWLISILAKDVSIIDMAFGLLMAGCGLAAYLVSEAGGSRGDILLILALVWGLRLTLHLVWRNLGKGEDPRYTNLRKNTGEGWPFHFYSLRYVFLMQGAIVWIATLPLQLGIAKDGPNGLGFLAIIGVAIWAIGFLFEAISDEQLRRFKSNPNNKGKVLNTGLWKYTRHPNYFGELCVWWGIYFIAIDDLWLIPTIIGPLLYSYIVINITGKAVLDKKMAEEKPEYASYVERTNGLIPWFPK